MTLIDFAILIIQTFAMLFIVLCVVRMLLQIVRADYYNPISQSIIKATDKMVIPLRRVVPSIGPIDTASLLSAFIVSFISGFVILALINVSVSLPTQLSWAFIGVLLLITKILWWALLISVILSWFPAAHSHPIAQLIMQIGFGATAPLRKLAPNMGPIDITPIIGFLIIIGLEGLLVNIASTLGMTTIRLYGWF